MKVVLDSKPFPYKKALTEAFSGIVDSDLPLVLELVFLSEEEIRALNERERGVDAVTDVLSFPSSSFEVGMPIRAENFPDCVEPVFGTKKGERVQKGARLYLGSVAICTARAAEQAEEYGHSYDRELCYLAAHGFLHCLGYDHMTEEDKRVMRAKEEELMEQLGLGRGE